MWIVKEVRNWWRIRIWCRISFTFVQVTFSIYRCKSFMFSQVMNYIKMSSFCSQTSLPPSISLKPNSLYLFFSLSSQFSLLISVLLKSGPSLAWQLLWKHPKVVLFLFLFFYFIFSKTGRLSSFNFLKCLVFRLW